MTTIAESTTVPPQIDYEGVDLAMKVDYTPDSKEEEKEIDPMYYLDRGIIPPGYELVTKPLKDPVARIRVVPQKTTGVCGHRVDTGAFPSSKCHGCWGSFFLANELMTSQNMKVIKEGNTADLTASHGKRYTKMLTEFIRYVQTVAATREPKGVDGN